MKLAIIGASGHAREVLDIALETGHTEIRFLSKMGNEEDIGSFPVIRDEAENVRELNDEGYSFAIGIGDPKTRRQIYEKYSFARFPNLIHPSATFGRGQRERIEEREGNVICAGCRFTNNIDFGDFCLLNLNATISHDCIIGSFTSIMSGANISGNVELGRSTYIGVGASVIQGSNEEKLSIGENSVVGAGAVVIESIPKNVTCVGVPAKILR